MLDLLAVAFLWYISSSFATGSSKRLIQEQLSGEALTLFQLVISFVLCKLYGLVVSGKQLSKSHPKRDLYVLSFWYTCGFVTLNLSMTYIHVPLAMTLRAAEPLVAFAVSLLFFNQKPKLWIGLSLIPIAAGCGLCSYSAVDFNMIGFGLLMLSNLSFTMRSLIGKKVQEKTGIKGVLLFGYVCQYGCIYQALIWCGKYALKGRLEPNLMDMWQLILLNGVCYWMYLTCSFVMLSKISAITHTVLNAMRRPVIIGANAMYFQIPLSFQSKVGIGLACVGSLLYAQIKKMQAKKIKVK